jgi:hypothetical protein
VFHLRDHVKKHGFLAAEADKEKLRLGLDESYGWLLRPERRERHRHSIPPLAVNYLQSPCFVVVTNVGCRFS